MKFNDGKAYHGSSAVEGGKLKGQTGATDYFFFLCPQCNNGQIMRILESDTRLTTPVARAEERKQPVEHFNLALRLYCPACQFEDFTKINNDHRCNRLEIPK